MQRTVTPSLGELLLATVAQQPRIGMRANPDLAASTASPMLVASLSRSSKKVRACSSIVALSVLERGRHLADRALPRRPRRARPSRA